ncbi:MAG: sulfite oxidase [Gemmataceae bacterium]
MAEERKIVTQTPENSETPLDAVCSWVTPTKLFFVRNHFDVPTIDPKSWSLTIEGCVDQPKTLKLRDLEAMPQQTVFVTLECAGNGRSYLSTPVHGVQWGAGAVAHAEWTGVPLAKVFEGLELTPDALEVVFEGADNGIEGKLTEPIHFVRSLPIEKAMHPDTILALRMNGEPLTPDHGFPVRLLVPGWYGVASVKWVQRIEVVNKPFEGYYQTYKYTIGKQTPEGIANVGVQGMTVKSEIIRPREDEAIGIGSQRIFGMAWAGEHAVAKVEISTDGGETWGEARLVGLQAPYSWTMWEYFWEVATAGQYEILSRATSTNGDTQPLEHDRLRAGYMINFLRSRRVVVESRTVDQAKRQQYSETEALLYDFYAFSEANAAMTLDVDMELMDGAGI